MPMEIMINPNLENLPRIDYRLTEDLQDDLKELNKDDYNKLRTSLKENGLLMPLCLWVEPSSSKMFLIDGHQRKRLFNMENVKPYEIPYILIPGETINDAKKNLLQISSQYGKITDKGFNNFVFNLDIPSDWIDNTITFAALKSFGESSQQKPITNIPKEIDLKPFNKTHILISFSPEKLIDIQELLKPLLEHPDVEVEQSSN